MLKKNLDKGPSGGMVDALVSGASVERRASSSLVVGTKITQLWRGGGMVDALL